MDNNLRFISELPIDIPIYDNNSNFTFIGSKYNYGDTLLELFNLDIENIKHKVIPLPRKISLGTQQITLSSLDLLDTGKGEESNIINLLERIKRLQCKSIFYNIIRNSIVEYCCDLKIERFDYSLDKINFDKINFLTLYNLIQNSFEYLLLLKTRVINLFSILDGAAKEYESFNFAQRLEKIKTSFFDTTIISSHYVIDKQSPGIVYKHVFYNVNEFFYYIVLKFLEKPFKFIICRECGKFLIVEKYGRFFCDQKCSNNYAKHNIFYRKYLYKIQYLSQQVNEGKLEEMKRCELQQEYRKIYDKYIGSKNTAKNIENMLKEFEKVTLK